ncbi:MAG: DNA-methyltransferase, partial [Candidatus Thorarchaeota archaeon]
MISLGDAQRIPLADNSVHCVVTSPPYWRLRNYGLDGCQWQDGWFGVLGSEDDLTLYLSHLVAIMREVRRVLRDDGTLWLNMGDSYSSAATQRSGLRPKNLAGVPWRLALALQEDGWYLRSDIIWAKANCMPESVSDRPTRAHEYLFLLTKQPRYYYDAQAIAEPLAASTLADHRLGWYQASYVQRDYPGPAGRGNGLL